MTAAVVHAGAVQEFVPSLLTVRVPLLPARIGKALLSGADPLASTRELLRTSPLFDSALYLASTSLHDALSPWLETGQTKKSRAPLRALAYALRMTTRATPFGLFAGVGSIGRVQSEALHLAPLEKTRFVAYPSSSWLQKVYEGLEGDPLIRESLPVVCNDVRLTRGNRLYWGDPRRLKRGLDPVDSVALQYEMVSARESEVLARVIEIARLPKPLRELREELAKELGMPPETASAFVERLLGLGLLLFRRPVGKDGLDFIEELALDEGWDCARDFTRVRSALSSLNAIALPELDRAAIEQCRTALLSVREYDRTPFQIDVIESVEGSLPQMVLDDVKELSTLMLASAQPRPLDEYRTRFLRRYEGDSRRIPLLELVDPDAGIGMPQDSSQQRPDQHEGRNEVRFHLASRALHEGTAEIELTKADIAMLFPNSDQAAHMEHGWEIGFQVIAESADDVAQGRYLLRSIPTLASDGPFKSINRFASHGEHGLDSVADRVDACPDEGTLPVELVFASDSHYADLLQVPKTGAAIASSWERVPDEVERIEPADILIGLEGSRFVAFSKRQCKRLLIRESYMFYVPYFAAPHIRLLSLIGKQDHVLPAAFDWGSLHNMPSLPRLKHGRLVLSPARWSVPRAKIETHRNDIGAFLKEWRSAWEVPRFVCLVERDLRLPIDLDAPIANDIVIENLKPPSDGYPVGSHIRFEEMLPNFDQAWLERDGERHFHEFVAGFAATAKPVLWPVPALDVSPDAPKGPGSEWVYAKLYCGRSELDATIRTLVGEVLEATNDLSVDRWFFLRYADPDSHIRLRLRSRRDAATIMLRMAALCSKALEQGLIQRYAFDTYQPETEKYGGPRALDLAEELFLHDSNKAMEFVASGASSWEQRIAYSLQRSAAFLTTWFTQFDMTNWLRGHEQAARSVRTIDWDRVKSASRMLRVSPGLGEQEAALVAALRDLERQGLLKASPEQLCDNLLHMQFNRIGVPMHEELVMRAIVWHACHGLEKQGLLTQLTRSA